MSAGAGVGERELDRRGAALGRSRAYGLLAKLILRGLDGELLAALREADWLLEPALARGPADLEAVAAAHHQAFFLDVFPYAGAFLDPSGSAGAWADRVRGFYDRAGFTPRLDELAADHLGIELVFASFVSAAIAEALEDGRPTIADELELLLAEFLDACLLSWLPAMVSALERSVVGVDDPGRRLWPHVVAEALEMIADHRAQLPGPRRGPQLQPAPDLLADERTGLRRIAEHLLTPVVSGLFLGRVDIAGLGRGAELPRGFGSRLLTLDNLLRSAVDYGGLGQVLGDLDAVLRAEDRALAERAERLGLAAAIEPWREALAQTRGLLDQLALAEAEVAAREG